MNSKRTKGRSSLRRPIYKSSSLTMPENTRGFLQKICYKRTATVDMTQYGFISKASPINFLLRPLKDTLEKICGPSDNSKTPQPKTTATTPPIRGKKGSRKLHKTRTSSPQKTISMKELIKTQVPLKQRDQSDFNKLAVNKQRAISSYHTLVIRRKQKKPVSRTNHRVLRKKRASIIKAQKTEPDPSNPKKEYKKTPGKKMADKVNKIPVQPAATRERKIKFSVNSPEVIGFNSPINLDE